MYTLKQDRAKDLTLYLMIKTKSRSCKGAYEQQKHPQHMPTGYGYNPALRNLQCLILGLTGLTLKTKRWQPTFCFG